MIYIYIYIFLYRYTYNIGFYRSIKQPTSQTMNQSASLSFVYIYNIYMLAFAIYVMYIYVMYIVTIQESIAAWWYSQKVTAINYDIGKV